MPIVATGEFDLLDMVVLLCFIRPIQALFAEGQEHGRTIPLADITRARGSRITVCTRHTDQEWLRSRNPQIAPRSDAPAGPGRFVVGIPASEIFACRIGYRLPVSSIQPCGGLYAGPAP
jgi:hypothetical protein